VNSPKEVLSESSGIQEGWRPVLEVAVHEVFELMLGCRLTDCNSASDGTAEEPLDITAMVGLAGQLSGVLSLQCSAKSSALMASKMLGVNPDQISPEVCDAFGEICNMVAGNFKNKIAGLADGCMLSVPTVIIGDDYNLHSVTDSPVLEIRLQFETGPLVIRLQIHN
jgi:chemotaxis protein CheX